MANVYNTKVYLYKGTDYNPDGTPVPWTFCTAWFEDDESNYQGEYLFAVDENGNMYPTGTVGNAATADEVIVFENYMAMLMATKED